MAGLEAALRRHWPLVLAVAVFAAFMALHTLWFGPVVRRYQAAIREVTELGMPLDPAGSPMAVSPRILTLLRRNSVPEAEAVARGSSGELTADLLRDLTRLAARRGLDVVATEQGNVTQLPGSVQVRAHVRMRGSYAAFVALLDDLARAGRLDAVDRFSAERDQQRLDFDLWVSRMVLKQAARRAS